MNAKQLASHDESHARPGLKVIGGPGESVPGQGSVSKKIAVSVKKVSRWLFLVGSLIVVASTITSKQALDSKITALASFMSTTSADQISNYDLDSLEKSVKYSMRDSDITYVGYFDAKGKDLMQAGDVKKWHSRVTMTIQKGDSAELGQVTIAYSNNKILFWALGYVILGAFGILWFQRAIKREYEGISDAIVAPTRVVVDRLSEASQLILGSSSGLVDSSNTLAHEVASQTAATTQSMSAMTEMGEMVSRTAEVSKLARARVNEAERRTQQGEVVVRKMSTSMASIEDATSELKQIYNIVGGIATKASLINEIVFQTKLLSFNASVEAARAGEHGRGFAVVAEEIGNLAVMSGSAAKEINDLLGQSREHVDRIVASTTARISDVREVSTETIKMFEEIAKEIRSVASQIQQIDQAATEQDAGVRNTQDAIMKIEEISRKSNEVAEGVRQSAEGLSTQSQSITDVIGELRRMM